VYSRKKAFVVETTGSHEVFLGGMWQISAWGGVLFGDMASPDFLIDAIVDNGIAATATTSSGGFFFDPLWWRSFWSFLAGAGVVAVFWAFQILRGLLPDEIAADDTSWVDPWNNLREKSWKVIVENSEFYYYNHIGELPPPLKRRSHWPWQTRKRRLSPRNEVTSSQEEEEEKRSMSLGTSSFGSTSAEPVSDAKNSNINHNQIDNDEHEKEFCIGSIFGMDVGGTLAKLVYFEQKSDDGDHLFLGSGGHRNSASSAQAAWQVRNSCSTSNIDISNTPPTTSTTTRRTSATQGNMSVSSPSGRHRRSVSLGSVGRFKDLQRQMYEVGVGGLSPDTVPSRIDKNPVREEKRSSLRPRPTVGSRYSQQTEELRKDLFRDDTTTTKTVPVSVSFEGTDPERVQENHNKDIHHHDDVPTTPNMRKSRSLFDFSQSKQKAEALDRFYSFARRLDSYENSVRDHQLSFFSRELGGEFHFIHFESRWMNHAMELIRYHDLHLNISKMGATGGGAHKYATEWEENLGIQMDKQEELDSLVAGMQFVLSTVVGECYTFRPHDGPKPGLTSTPSSPTVISTDSDPDVEGTDDDHQVGGPLLDESYEDLNAASSTESNGVKETPIVAPTAVDDDVKTGMDISIKSDAVKEKPSNKKTKVDEWWWSRKVQRDAISYSKSYPYLLVTIGTGVSILRVDGPRKHERISGSTIGGGTYWGLIRLLTDVEDFEAAMRLAERGDPAKVDMMVGDIYGENSDALEKLGLPSDVVASSFGKLVSKEDPAAGVEQEDLARALLLMITNNIGQVSYLNAKLHNTRRIYFVGNFLRGNALSQRRLSYAIDYWSKGDMEALFLEHEGYFGALGAFLMSQKIGQDDGGFVQWGERVRPSPERSTSSYIHNNERMNRQSEKNPQSVHQQHHPRKTPTATQNHR